MILYLAACLLAVAYSQACPQMEDRVTKLKNFNTKYTFPCSYSGFVNVDEVKDSNLLLNAI
ncbi:unnamed protein product [Moneuplotes crassus]|uniref:Uncharacterized protein n=1 Tax=Euplotes crassus TaxID=5936 RepID=A0AAD1XWE9_EUPCR|nr:unnamed protein product [Moneuplotes crassus]